MRTDFLPDARRAAAEEELRAQLTKEYTLRQQVAWPVADSTSREIVTDVRSPVEPPTPTTAMAIVATLMCQRGQQGEFQPVRSAVAKRVVKVCNVSSQVDLALLPAPCSW